MPDSVKNNLYNSESVNRYAQDEDDEYAVYSISRPLYGEKQNTSGMPNEDEQKKFVEAKKEALAEKDSVGDDPEILKMLEDSFIIELIQMVKGAGNSLSAEVATSLGFPEIPQAKIHTDSAAVFLCEMLDAKAFALGNDIFFNEGAFNLSSREGKLLLSHELTHIKQQEHKNVQRKKKEESPQGLKMLVELKKQFHKARKSGNKKETNSFASIALAWFGLRKKLKLDDFEMGGVWKATEEEDLKIDFSNKQPNDIAPKEGIKPGTIDADADLDKGHVLITSGMMPISSMKYVGEGFVVNTQAINLGGLSFKVTWPAELKGDDIVKGNIELKLAEGFIHDLDIDFGAKGDHYKIGLTALKELSLTVNNITLGQARELRRMQRFIGFSQDILTDLSQVLMYSIKELITASMRKKGEKISEPTHEDDLMQSLIRQNFGDANIVLNLSKGVSMTDIDLHMAGEKDSYHVNKLDMASLKVSLLSVDKTSEDLANQNMSNQKSSALQGNQDSDRLVELKSELRVKQRKLNDLIDKSKKKQKEKNVNEREINQKEKDLTDKIEKLKQEIFRYEKERKHTLNIDATTIQIEGADNVVQKSISDQATTEGVSAAPALIHTFSLNSSFTGDQVDKYTLSLPEIQVPSFVLNGIQSEKYNLSAKAIRITEGKGSLTLSYDKEKRLSIEKLTFKAEKLQLNAPVFKFGDKEVRVLENSPDAVLNGLSVDINHDTLDHLHFDSANAAEAQVPGIISSTPVLKTGAFNFDRVSDDLYSYKLEQLDLLSTYDNQKGNQATAETRNASFSGTYDRRINKVTSSINLPVLKIGPVNLVSENGLSYLKMPTGNTELINVKAEICMDLQSDTEDKDKPFYKNIEISNLHADALKSNGLQARLQSSEKDKPLNISFPSDKQGMLTDLNVQLINITDTGLKNISQATAASAQVPELELSMGEKFSVAGNVSTGAIKFNYAEGETTASIKNTHLNQGDVHAGKSFSASGNISADEITYAEKNGTRTVDVDNLKSKNDQIVIGKNKTTGNIDTKHVKYIQAEDGSQEIIVDAPSLNKGSILIPASKKDEKDLKFDLSSIGVKQVVVHISKDEKTSLYVQDALVKNVHFTIDGTTYSMDISIPGKTKIEEVEKEKFGDESSLAWMVTAEKNVSVKNISIVTTEFKITKNEPDEDVERLNKANSLNQDSLFQNQVDEYQRYHANADKILPQKTRDYIVEYNNYLYPGKSSTDLYGTPGYNLYKMQGEGALLEQLERIKKTKKNLNILDAIDNADGSLTLNMFGQEFSVPVFAGAIDLQSVLNNELAEAASSYIDKQKLEFLNQEKIRKITGEFDGSIATADAVAFHSIDILHNTSKLINGIQDKNGKQALVEYVTYFLKNISINKSKDPTAFTISVFDGLIPFVDQKYIQNNLVSIKGIMEYQLKNNMRKNESSLTDIARTIHVKNLSFDQFLDELDKKLQDDSFFGSYKNDILPFVTEWFSMFAFSLIEREIKTFGIELYNIPMKSLQDHFNTLGYGTLNFAEHDRHSAVFDSTKAPAAFKINENSNKENINFEYINIPGFTYLNPDKNLKLSTERVLVQPSHVARTKDNTTIKSSEGLNFVNLKLFIKR
jgi:hypothetical protein